MPTSFLDTLTAAVAPVTTWLPSADGTDPAIHFDLVGQNFRVAKTERSFARALADAGGYFARPSVAAFFSPLGKLTSTAVDVPHIPWSVPLAAYRGLKIERQSANLLPKSNGTFSGIVSNATLATSPTLGPDGTQSLQRVTGTAAGGYTATNVSITAGTGPYTLSTIVPKTAASQTIRMSAVTAGGTGTVAYVDFDAYSGTVNSGNGLVYGVDDLGSFWLAWVAFTPASADTSIQPRFYPGGTTVTATADVGWMQLELGIYPTSRIVTTGTAGIRRERDYLAVPATAAFGTGTGTLTITVNIPGGAVERVIAQIDDGTENNSIRIRRSAAGNIEAVWTVAGTVTSTMALGAHTAGTSTTISVGWAAGTIKAIRDGSALTIVASAPPAGLTTLRLGGNTTASSLDGFIVALSTWASLRSSPFATAPVASFVALGDSMAAGSGASVPANQWNALLAAALGRTWQNDGYPGQSSATVLTNWRADPAHWAWTAIIFAGHNFTTTTDPAADIAAMVALMTADPRVKRFLVVSPLQNASNATGTSGFTSIVALRTALQAAYPANYVDLYGYLTTKGNGSAQDNADIAAGYTPTSLRADSIHLNDAGHALEAGLYQTELAKRGW